MNKAPLEQHLDVHGIHVRFRSPVSEHHSRLREDYGPFFVDHDGSDGGISFEVSRERLPSQPDQGAHLIEGSLGDVVTVHPGHRVHVAGPLVDDPRSYVSEIRSHFTAQILSELTWRHHAQLFHSSAVVGAAGAVMFAGAKKTGKSSFAMLCSLAGAEYMSNDMTVLRLDSTDSPDTGISAMGLPQAITLAPGALDWFARRRTEARIASKDSLLGPELDASNRYVLEHGDKSRIDESVLSAFTTFCTESKPLGAVVFPEPDMNLRAPRIRELSVDEAVARLAMLPETFLKWRWPMRLTAEELLERSSSVILAATASVPMFHLQWCEDHDQNFDAIRDLVM